MEKNAEYYFNKAFEAQQKNKLEEAKKYYEQSIKLSSDNLIIAIIYNNLASLLNSNYFKEYEKARIFCEKAIKLDNKNPIIYNNLAVLLQSDYFKEYDKAKEYYEKAIKLNSKDETIYNGLAYLLQNDYFKEYDKAKEYYEKAIKLNSKDETIYNSLIYNNLAWLLQSDYFKKYDKSKIYYEKAIELNPNDKDYYLDLALLLMHNFDDYKKAFLYVEKSRKLENHKVTNQKKQDISILSLKDKYTLQEEKKIKLQSVNLKNIGYFEDIQIDLNEKITCIIAENGLGKTSIVSSIALAIAGVNVNSIISNRNYEALSIIKKKLQIRDVENLFVEENKSIKYAKEGSIELKYKIDEKIYFNKIKLFNPENFEDIKVSDNSKDENSFAINKGDKNNYFHNLILGFPQGQVHHKKDLSFKGDFKSNISDIYPLITGIPSDSLHDFSRWVSRIYSDSSSNLDKHEITNVFKIISKIISNKDDFEVVLKDVKLNELGEPILIVTTLENPNGIPMQLLSQGLTNVFTWICHFMQRIYEHYGEFVNIEKIHAIVIIDEIDKYLHPKWQKKILQVLLEFFKNTQFIITTHSPLVLMGLERKQIARIKLKNDKAFVEYNDDFNVWGWEFQDVLERFMLKFDTSEYNLKAEENKLKLLKKQGVDEIKIADLEEKIMRIKESYEAEGELGKYKIQRNKAEGELKEQNKFLFELVKKLKKENEQLKS